MTEESSAATTSSSPQPAPHRRDATRREQDGNRRDYPLPSNAVSFRHDPLDRLNPRLHPPRQGPLPRVTDGEQRERMSTAGSLVIRPARLDEREALEALQWRASLANPGDRDALLSSPRCHRVPPAQIRRGRGLRGRTRRQHSRLRCAPRPRRQQHRARRPLRRAGSLAAPASAGLWSSIAPPSPETPAPATSTSSPTTTPKASTSAAASRR